MGKNLHNSIRPFWEKALNGHTNVARWKLTQHSTEYIYSITPNKFTGEIIIHATDEYIYGLTHYINRPNILVTGSMIYLARPEAVYTDEVAECANNEDISIGVFGEIMGALHIQNHASWQIKKRKERAEEKKNVGTI